KRVASGTKQFPVQMDTADQAMHNMYDLLFSYLNDTKPDLVEEYRSDMQVIILGQHHTIVVFNVYQSGTTTPIAGATVTDKSNSKQYTSDDDGVVTISEHRNGHFHFAIEAAGKQTIDLGVDIKRGMENEFSVYLQNV